MSTADIVGIAIVVVLVAAFAVIALWIGVQRRALHKRFGDEYERVVSEKGGRAQAEAELRMRQRRHAELALTELTPEVRADFAERWTRVQSQFVDDPTAAVRAADGLVARIVAERGYPVVDYGDRLAHLSVEHARVLPNYRDAHDASVRSDAGHASTEELRQALVHYRKVVADLLGNDDLLGKADPPSDADLPRNADLNSDVDLNSKADLSSSADLNSDADAGQPKRHPTVLVTATSTRMEE